MAVGLIRDAKANGTLALVENCRVDDVFDRVDLYRRNTLTPSRAVPLANSKAADALAAEALPCRLRL
jgi:hypothetical protein